ncbi:pyruvate/2-oxoglutarate dehydrogenase complex, dihydrolipoamide acyltransferase E2 component [Serpentinimonas maccroryi]|uniref:Pyruvate/2-oxoglutarate dehydrogenase complex, dihydrolipoamide acyltransferase E2 component n=1 Tax=Serpentinimonas maccroryi TaxID=1458426 RepID=A0A060NRX3_9BURK|nr:pyruvate/2-oxoglutarate dehydrogenase complex, dihydrolipoamide acyltransferase E2 component [Serpentinimonas maccroryi]
MPAPLATPAPPPAPPPPAPAPAPPPPPSPAAAAAPAPFTCEALPLGLRVTCTVEGQAIIRKCAPDLRNWNHNLPGCNRQAANTTN